MLGCDRAHHYGVPKPKKLLFVIFTRQQFFATRHSRTHNTTQVMVIEPFTETGNGKMIAQIKC